jgi:hypothetical protein
MSTRPEFAQARGSANADQSSSHLKQRANMRRATSTPYSSEDIDEQIRWFFENAAEEPLSPADSVE